MRFSFFLIVMTLGVGLLFPAGANASGCNWFGSCPPVQQPNRPIPQESTVPFTPEDTSFDRFSRDPQNLVRPRQFPAPYVAGAGVREKLVWRNNPRLCLEAPAVSLLQQGTFVVANLCSANSAAQVFWLSTSDRGQIVALPGNENREGYTMCLDYYPAGGNDGDLVATYPCHPLTEGQPDTQIWWPVDQFQLRSNTTGKCLAVDETSGPPYWVRLATCSRNIYRYVGHQLFRPTQWDWINVSDANYAGQGLPQCGRPLQFPCITVPDPKPALQGVPSADDGAR
jgi:hypothetical protein